MPEQICDSVQSGLRRVGLPTAGTWARVSSCSRAWAIATVAAMCTAVVLGAQTRAATNSPIPIPLEPGGFRRPDLELERGGEGREVVVYRWDSPMEPLARYYITQLGGTKDAPLDSAAVRPGKTTSISYHLTFWAVQDECADSAAAPTGAPCKHWRRGKDLWRALNNRQGFVPGVYLERVTFTWFSRDAQGVLTRWTAEVFDSGVSKDWTHYLPTVDLTIESEQLKG